MLRTLLLWAFPWKTIKQTNKKPQETYIQQLKFNQDHKICSKAILQTSSSLLSDSSPVQVPRGDPGNLGSALPIPFPLTVIVGAREQAPQLLYTQCTSQLSPDVNWSWWQLNYVLGHSVTAEVLPCYKKAMQTLGLGNPLQLTGWIAKDYVEIPFHWTSRSSRGQASQASKDSSKLDKGSARQAGSSWAHPLHWRWLFLMFRWRNSPVVHNDKHIQRT